MAEGGNVRVICTCGAKVAQMRVCLCGEPRWARTCRCGKEWRYGHEKIHAAFLDAHTAKPRVIHLPI